MDIIRTQYSSTMIINWRDLDLTSAVRPKVIMIVTSEIEEARHVHLRAALARYVETGGTLILCCWFASGTTSWGIEGILWEFQCGWKVKEGLETFKRDDLTLNPRMRQAFGEQAFVFLEERYTIEARHIQGVSELDQIYCQQPKEGSPAIASLDMRAEAVPSAFRKHGKGMLGYVGDVKMEKGTCAVIVAMLEAVVSPFVSPPTVQAFAGSSITPQERQHRADQLSAARPTLNDDPSGPHPPIVRQSPSQPVEKQNNRRQGPGFQSRSSHSDHPLPAAHSIQQPQSNRHSTTASQAPSAIASENALPRRGGGHSTRRIRHLPTRSVNSTLTGADVKASSNTSSVEIIVDSTNYRQPTVTPHPYNVQHPVNSFMNGRISTSEQASTTLRASAPEYTPQTTTEEAEDQINRLSLLEQVLEREQVLAEENEHQEYDYYGGGYITPSPHTDLSGPPYVDHLADPVNIGDVLQPPWDSAATDIVCGEYARTAGAQNVAVEDKAAGPSNALMIRRSNSHRLNSTRSHGKQKMRRKEDVMPALAACNPGCAVCTILMPANICTGCRRVQYCSIACQKKDWPPHKEVCKPLTGSKVKVERDEDEVANGMRLIKSHEDTKRTNGVDITDLLENSASEDFYDDDLYD